MAQWYYAFKDTLGDYIHTKRRQDPSWSPSPGLQWTYDNLGWMQAIVLFGAASGMTYLTGGLS